MKMKISTDFFLYIGFRFQELSFVCFAGSPSQYPRGHSPSGFGGQANNYPGMTRPGMGNSLPGGYPPGYNPAAMNSVNQYSNYNSHGYPGPNNGGGPPPQSQPPPSAPAQPPPQSQPGGQMNNLGSTHLNNMAGMGNQVGGVAGPGTGMKGAQAAAQIAGQEGSPKLPGQPG